MTTTHIVTLGWTPGQDHGLVAVLRNRVPVVFVVGLLAAGEGPEAVALEYGLAIEEVMVLDRLRRDLAPDSPEETW